MSKKVLLTNFNMVNYSGSELDTLTIANYFLSLGYDVSVFTIEAGFPLLNDIDERIKIIECIDHDRLEEKYDLIWAHHYPLLDYLLFSKKIIANHIAYISLSSYEPYETIPPYYKYLDYVSILSQEGMDALVKEEYDVSNIEIFGNYSYKKYFENPKKKISKQLKKICVVSNHVPLEIEECKKIAESNNVQFDIFGKEHNYVKVDDKLLKQYDVIISIGKTVNYGLSLCIPVYCYDHFGGDGYITKENIKKSHDYNFSGRYSKNKLTGKQLFQDLYDNYKYAIKSIDYNYEYAYNNFCFETMVDKLLRKIEKHKKINVLILQEKFNKYVKTSGLFMREIINNKLKSKDSIIKKCKVYFDYGNGFSEKQSSTYFYKKNNLTYSICIHIKDNIKRIKIDYANNPFVELIEIKIDNETIPIDYPINTIRINNIDISYNYNPSIILSKISKGKKNIKLKMKLVCSEQLLRYINKKECENIKLNNKIVRIESNIFYRTLRKIKLIRNK